MKINLRLTQTIALKFYELYKNFDIKKNNQFFLIHDLKTHWPYLMDSNCNFKHFKGRNNLKE